ncbi:MAG: diguanylate cyclase domain-containing protein [Eubacterium sp.]
MLIFLDWKKGVFDYAMEKSTVKVHPDDRDKYLKGFSDRMQGKHLNERFEYRLMTGKYTCSLFSAYGQIVQDEQGEPALLVLVAENHGISDEIDSVTGLYSEEVFDEHINDMIQRKIPAAILKVGIEQFSRINVLYGVEYANRVLSEVTYLLRWQRQTRDLCTAFLGPSLPWYSNGKIKNRYRKYTISYRTVCRTDFI